MTSSALAKFSGPSLRMFERVAKWDEKNGRVMWNRGNAVGNIKSHVVNC